MNIEVAHKEREIPYAPHQVSPVNFLHHYGTFVRTKKTTGTLLLANQPSLIGCHSTFCTFSVSGSNPG